MHERETQVEAGCVHGDASCSVGGNVGTRNQEDQGKPFECCSICELPEMFTFSSALIVLTQCYATSLLFLSLFTLPINISLTPHATLVILSDFIAYFVRNVVPLGTYTMSPLDLHKAPAWMLWTEIALMFLVGFALPIIEPRAYTPIDPQVNSLCQTIYSSY
jgi:hypothetical protein